MVFRETYYVSDTSKKSNDDHSVVPPTPVKKKSHVQPNKYVGDGTAADVECGFFCWRPRAFQCLAKSLWTFIGFYGLSGLCLAASGFYMRSQMTSMERHFRVSTGKMGVLMAANDIGSVAVVMFVSHFGKFAHIPRLLGAASFLGGLFVSALALVQVFDPVNLPSVASPSFGNPNNTPSDPLAAMMANPMLLCAERPLFLKMAINEDGEIDMTKIENLMKNPFGDGNGMGMAKMMEMMGKKAGGASGINMEKMQEMMANNPGGMDMAAMMAMQKNRTGGRGGGGGGGRGSSMDMAAMMAMRKNMTAGGGGGMDMAAMMEMMGAGGMDMEKMMEMMGGDKGGGMDMEKMMEMMDGGGMDMEKMMEMMGGGGMDMEKMMEMMDGGGMDMEKMMEMMGGGGMDMSAMMEMMGGGEGGGMDMSAMMNMMGIGGDSGGTRWGFYYTFVVMIVIGALTAPRVPLQIFYIESNVKDKTESGVKVGTLTTAMLFGGPMSLLVGFAIAMLPVDLSDTQMTFLDPRWIGAWWLGFVVLGAASTLFSLPVCCLPKRIRNTSEALEDNKASWKEKRSSSTFEEKSFGHKSQGSYKLNKGAVHRPSNASQLSRLSTTARTGLEAFKGRPTAHFTPYHKKVCSFDMKAGSPTRYTMSEVRRGTMKVFPCATRRVLLLYLLSASMVIGAAKHKGRFFVVAFPLSIDVTTKQAQFLSVANMEGASANVVITRPSIASEQPIIREVSAHDIEDCIDLNEDFNNVVLAKSGRGGRAVFIHSDRDITVVAHNVIDEATRWATGCHLVYPFERLGTEYIAVTDCTTYNCFILVVAAGQNVDVTVKLSLSTPRGVTRTSDKGPLQVVYSGVAYGDASVISESLAVAEFMQIRSAKVDLSGSRVTSNVPVALISGGDYTLLRGDVTSSEGMVVDQVPPLHELGREYALVSAPGINEDTLLKVVYTDGGTQRLQPLGPQGPSSVLRPVSHENPYGYLTLATGAAAVLSYDKPVLVMAISPEFKFVYHALAGVIVTPVSSWGTIYSMAMPKEDTTLVIVSMSSGGESEPKCSFKFGSTKMDPQWSISDDSKLYFSSIDLEDIDASTNYVSSSCSFGGYLFYKEDGRACACMLGWHPPTDVLQTASIHVSTGDELFSASDVMSTLFQSTTTETLTTGKSTQKDLEPQETVSIKTVSEITISTMHKPRDETTDHVPLTTTVAKIITSDIIFPETDTEETSTQIMLGKQGSASSKNAIEMTTTDGQNVKDETTSLTSPALQSDMGGLTTAESIAEMPWGALESETQTIDASTQMRSTHFISTFRISSEKDDRITTSSSQLSTGGYSEKVQVLEQTTPYLNESVSKQTANSSRLCACSCLHKQTWGLLSESRSQLEAALQEQVRMLKMNRSLLSSLRRRHSSAVNSQDSARGIGATLTIAVFLAVIALVLLVDLYKLCGLFQPPGSREIRIC